MTIYTLYVMRASRAVKPVTGNPIDLQGWPHNRVSGEEYNEFIDK